MPNPMPPTDNPSPPAAPATVLAPTRALLGNIATMARRLQGYALFFGHLRILTADIDRFARIAKDGFQPPGTKLLQLHTWPILVELGKNFEETLEELDAIIQDHPALSQPSPAPRPGNRDINPRDVCGELALWASDMTVICQDATNVKLMPSCDDVVKKLRTHNLSCARQIQHESSKLNEMVNQLEPLL